MIVQCHGKMALLGMICLTLALTVDTVGAQVSWKKDWEADAGGGAQGRAGQCLHLPLRTLAAGL